MLKVSKCNQWVRGWVSICLQTFHGNLCKNVLQIIIFSYVTKQNLKSKTSLASRSRSLHFIDAGDTLHRMHISPQII